MSLLSVTVKKARYVGIQATQLNTYVTLKLQNVKSTTVTVKGPTPCWEQDFLFETNDINLGLLVEVWNKGVIWDRAIGYHYLPLTSVAYNEELGGRWIELEAQLMMRGGAVVGTTGHTGHALLLECRFEPPFDAEGTGGADLQRKLDLLNSALDAERAEQARRQMQYIHQSGHSEDSDYTSDLNYPVGQHANCSASQFRNAAHQMLTPQRSLEVSRENSYEREEYHMHGDTDPLYYNSQPRTRIETWSHQYQPELRAQASVESAVSWRTAADWQSQEEQRRPSLERQNTLYDDLAYGFDGFTASTHIRDHSARISAQASYEEYYDSTSYPYQTSYLGDDSRTWDSGGRYFYDDSYGQTPTEYENIMNKRRSSAVQLPQVPSGRQLPMASSRYSDSHGMAPYIPRQRRIPASLPVTPSSTPKRHRALPRPPDSESGSVQGSRGRRLPRPPGQPFVPYVPEPKKSMPNVSRGYDSYGYQAEYPDTLSDQLENTNYASSIYDSDGMQPFFDDSDVGKNSVIEVSVKKTQWNEPGSSTQFSYPATSENDNLLTKSVPSTPAFYLQQPPKTSLQNTYQDQTYGYNHQLDQQLNQQLDQQYAQYGQQDQNFNNQNDQKPYQKDVYQEPRQELSYQQQFEEHKRMQQQQQLKQQQQQPTQQLQASVMTGAATLGSFMAGGAKKLGSFFGAAAAAVAPTIPQPPATTVSLITPYSSAVTSATPFNTSATVTVASVPEVSPSAPTAAVTTLAPVALPRTPSLRRQESIQRPPVRRIRTLPDAPEDLASYDESAYEDEYNKTEYEQTDRTSQDRDRTSLETYRDEDYTIHEENKDSIYLPVVDETSLALQKTASPTRNGSRSHVRKPSVDSYHSPAPSIVDRRTSQSSFHHEEKIAVPIIPTTQEESVTDKTKVTFKDGTAFHELAEGAQEFNDDQERYDEQDEFREERELYQEEEDFREEPDEEFQGDDPFREGEEFQENQQEEQPAFTEPQPKLTPKQRWHRAYNKVVMQLNHFE